MGKIIAITNHKGGTGKTTTTLNAGMALARQEKRILVIDLDAQANLSQSLMCESEPETMASVFERKLNSLPIKIICDRFHLVPASLDLSAIEPSLYSNINSYFLLKDLLLPVKEKYDFILIDCPPSLGIFTQNALIASDGIIITAQAQYLSIKGLDTVYNLVKTIREKLNPSIETCGLVVTQTNHTKLNKDLVTALRQNFEEQVFATTIRQSVALAEASLNRQDIFTYSPASNGAIDYMNLATEILKR